MSLDNLTSLSDLSDLVLTYIATYGPLALGVALMVAALGAPLPGTFFVIAAGAFVQQGVLDWLPTLVIALGCVVVGDLLSFGIGKVLHQPLYKRLATSLLWQQSATYFNQRGALAIYLTRWLFTPIAVPVNFVAAFSGYPAVRFGLSALAGEFTWLLGYGILGYLFGSQWEAVSTFVSDFSGLLIGVLILIVGLYFLFRLRKSHS